MRLAYSTKSDTKNINQTVAGIVRKDRTMRVWFKKFKLGDTSIERKKGSKSDFLTMFEPTPKFQQQSSHK
jgi:hypothetical protein